MRPMKLESLMDPDGTMHLDRILWPKLASPKLDGNRCYIEDGQAKSSSGKPIRNDYIREILSDQHLNGLDGELIVGSPTAPDVRRKTTSGVSKKTGGPDFTFYVFDMWNLPLTFKTRLAEASHVSHKHVYPVSHVRINDLETLLEYEQDVLARGYEGIVLRDPAAPYKQGRSTLRENWGLKLKRFLDAEAEILSVYERMHNDNPRTRNAHGKAERSNHKENLRPAGDLGGFEVKDCKTGVEFRVGTGFTADQRKELWLIRGSLPGKLVTYKHFPIGAKDKPNLSSFVDFRDGDDL